jgi:hypothetical protein
MTQARVAAAVALGDPNIVLAVHSHDLRHTLDSLCTMQAWDMARAVIQIVHNEADLSECVVPLWCDGYMNVLKMVCAQIRACGYMYPVMSLLLSAIRHAAPDFVQDHINYMIAEDYAIDWIAAIDAALASAVMTDLVIANIPASIVLDGVRWINILWTSYYEGHVELFNFALPHSTKAARYSILDDIFKSSRSQRRSEIAKILLMAEPQAGYMVKTRYVRALLCVPMELSYLEQICPHLDILTHIRKQRTYMRAQLALYPDVLAGLILEYVPY